MTLHSSVETLTTEGTATISVDVRMLYNFGYAGRDTASVQEHIDELVELGLPVPESVPALFPLPPLFATTGSAVSVSGTDSYGEVEFALNRADDGKWYVTVASDHSDFEIEKLSTSKSKTVYPDVTASTVWPLAEVRDGWDALVLTNRRTDGAGTEVIQKSSVATPSTPDALLATLEDRIGCEIPAGTVVLSGTVAGLPQSGSGRPKAGSRSSTARQVLFGGPGFDTQLADRMTTHTGVPALTTATEVVRALRHVGATSIAAGTPYIDELNVLEQKFFEAAGFDVRHIERLQIGEDRDISRLTAAQARALARSAMRDGVDALFLSCTNMPTVPLLAELEEQFGVPVISGNSATLWGALNTLGAPARSTQLGGLLASVGTTPAAGSRQGEAQ